MPFAFSPKTPWGHLQPDNDPIRAVAERADSYIADCLLSAWHVLAAGMKPHNSVLPGPALLTEWGNAVADAMSPAIGTLMGVWAGVGRDLYSQSATTVRKDFSLSFNWGQPAPETQDEAANFAAAWVREIGQDTRSTLNTILQQGIAAQLAVPDIGRSLREAVGLTVAQVAAVQNYRRLLVAGSPAAQDAALRDPRYDVAPGAIANLTAEQIDQRVDAYHRRYLNYRATTISRYETLAASNGGAVSAMRSLVRAGVMPGATTVGWLIAKDEHTCPRCRSVIQIQPHGVKFGQPFHWRAGRHQGIIYWPPLHPECRCTVTFHV